VKAASLLTRAQLDAVFDAYRMTPKAELVPRAGIRRADSCRSDPRASGGGGKIPKRRFPPSRSQLSVIRTSACKPVVERGEIVVASAHSRDLGSS
jgi:hypothetical protein